MAPPNSQAGPGSAPAPNSQATKVVYAGQTEAELRAEYDKARAENPGLFGGILTLGDYIKYKAGAAANQTNQEQQLEKVVESYRPPMSSVCSYYLGYDHTALKSMVNDNMDPKTADEQGDAWTKIGNALVDLQSNLTKATEASKDAWQGKAAGAAQGYFAGVAKWSGDAAQAAQLTGNKLSAQQNAAENAKNSMPEPVEFSTADAYKMFFSEPNPFKWADTIDKIEAKFEEKQAAHEQAAEVMNTMSTGFQEAGSTMPAFAPPPPMDGGGGGENVPPPGTGDPSKTGSNPPNIGNIGPGTGNRGLGDLGTSGIKTPGGGGDTNQSGWIPGGGTGGGGGGGGTGGGGGGGTGGGGGQYPGGGPFPVGPGGRPGVPGGGRPGQGVPGGGRGGPGGTGGGRGGAGGGMPGGGRGGLGGGPGGMAAAKGFGPGGSAGMLGESGNRSGSGGFGPAGSGGMGGAGGAGRGGAAGMGAGGMGAGGAKGQGDEDKEHKSASYLVETEDVFGDGTMVAPPVIGG